MLTTSALWALKVKIASVQSVCLLWCADLFKKHHKHSVLLFHRWEINGTAFHQFSSCKLIMWYSIKTSSLSMSSVHEITIWNTGDIRKQCTSADRGVMPDELPSAGRVVSLLKFGTYQGNERRRAAPEQHPGDMEGLSLQRWVLLGRFSIPVMPYGETEDRAKQSTPLLLGGYEKEYKGRKVNMDGMDPEECSPQQHSVCQSLAFHVHANRSKGK